MKTISIIFLNLIFCLSVFASGTDIILTIGDKEITKDEFLRIYNKNNNLPNNYDQKSVDEYLDLFVNYKLKVIEAEAQGYDTMPGFVKEFGGYRDQLAAPYLENTELTDKLLHEAYNRYIEERNVSHILIKLEENAVPTDTLKAWNMAMEIRERLLAGEPFEEVATETSEDPSAASNGGNLGWFNVFKMVYPFETAAYSTMKGEISEPVRSRFGYHIIKVNQIRKNRGSVKVSHIYVRVNPNPDELEVETARKKINEAYQALQDGKNWGEVVNEFTEHGPSKDRDGDFGWQSTGSVFDEFLEISYKTPIGEISDPFQSDYGFHIVKTMEMKPAGTFEEKQEAFSKKIKRDDARKGKLTKLTQLDLEQKYNVVHFKENIDQLLQLMDSTVYTKEWSLAEGENLDTKIFTIGEQVYTLNDFARYIENTKPKSKRYSFEYFLELEYDNFLSQSIKAYQKENLKTEYPDYAHLLQEYYDGILLFNISNDLVWEKATRDSAGLMDFYANLDKKHQWGERLDVSIYEISDSLLVESLLKIAKKRGKKGYTVEETNQKLCPDDTTMSCVSISDKKVEHKENSWVDSLKWEKGANLQTAANNKTRVYYVNKVLQPSNKTLEDARGLYIADYQNYLETEWIKVLREKHKVEVNHEVLNKLKIELEQN